MARSPHMTHPHLGCRLLPRVATVRGLLKDKGCEVVVTPQARQWLSAEGYNPAYGARPLKRTIQVR